MTRLQQLPIALQRSLEQRTTLKVIAGLMNFDAASVARVARAAGHGGADLIDVACDPALVTLAIGLWWCAGVCPRWSPSSSRRRGRRCGDGGDRQFRCLHPQGRIFEQLRCWSSPAAPGAVAGGGAERHLPHVLPMDQQEQLAMDLVAAGADLIQTEVAPAPSPSAPAAWD